MRKGLILGTVTGAWVVALAAGAAAQGSPPTAQATSPAAGLVKFEIRDNAIPTSLTGQPGDAQKGRQVIVNRQLGNCLACHEITALKNEPFHGNTGPGLDGVAERLTEGEIRLRLVDGTKVNPDTMMPSFYRVDGLNRVLPRFQGKTVLTAEQIEDVVAFLKTLK
jgi:L-cysteine S-thiosulfotransferase